jgi:hypothetical protein
LADARTSPGMAGGRVDARMARFRRWEVGEVEVSMSRR